MRSVYNSWTYTIDKILNLNQGLYGGWWLVVVGTEDHNRFRIRYNQFQLHLNLTSTLSIELQWNIRNKNVIVIGSVLLLVITSSQIIGIWNRLNPQGRIICSLRKPLIDRIIFSIPLEDLVEESMRSLFKPKWISGYFIIIKC